MFEKLLDYFLCEPKRLVGFGDALWQSGAWILLIGAFSHVATAAMVGLASMSKNVVHAMTLAEMFPRLPTWWVPESIIGAIPAITLCVLRLWVNSMGKRFQLYLCY